MLIEDFLALFRSSSSEAVTQRCSVKKLFFCEFCEISKNTFFLQNTSGWALLYTTGWGRTKNNSWYLYTIRRKNFAMAHQKQQMKSTAEAIFKGKYRNTRKKCEMWNRLKVNKKDATMPQWRCSDVFFYCCC